jgi:hypothetical protein
MQRRLATTSPAVAAGRSTHSTLIQAFVGADEYGFDVVNDLSAGYVTTFARKKLGCARVRRTAP